MSFLWAALIVVGVVVVAVGAMLLVRRRAPEGSYFEDGDRAAGVFGVLATGFAVLLGFVVFLAFESYDTSRSGARDARRSIVAQQFETAQFLPAAARERLSGELVCYARAVVHQEWPRMESGTLGDGAQPVGRRDVRRRCRPSSRARRPSRRRTPSSSTSAPTARTPAPTARTAPRA